MLDNTGQGKLYNYMLPVRRPGNSHSKTKWSICGIRNCLGHLAFPRYFIYSYSVFTPFIKPFVKSIASGWASNMILHQPTQQAPNTCLHLKKKLTFHQLFRHFLWILRKTFSNTALQALASVHCHLPKTSLTTKRVIFKLKISRSFFKSLNLHVLLHCCWDSS